MQVLKQSLEFALFRSDKRLFEVNDTSKLNRNSIVTQEFKLLLFTYYIRNQTVITVYHSIHHYKHASCILLH